MARDADAAIQERKEDLLDAELDHMYDVLNRKSQEKSDRWFDFE